jgi:hypothetical protein
MISSRWCAVEQTLIIQWGQWIAIFSCHEHLSAIRQTGWKTNTRKELKHASFSITVRQIILNPAVNTDTYIDVTTLKMSYVNAVSFLLLCCWWRVRGHKSLGDCCYELVTFALHKMSSLHNLRARCMQIWSCNHFRQCFSTFFQLSLRNHLNRYIRVTRSCSLQYSNTYYFKPAYYDTELKKCYFISDKKCGLDLCSPFSQLTAAFFFFLFTLGLNEIWSRAQFTELPMDNTMQQHDFRVIHDSLDVTTKCISRCIM